MEITTRNAIEVSESLSTFILGAYIKQTTDTDPVFEYYLQHVDTGKFSIADVYVPRSDTAIEVKSVAHGNAALKGVIQASMYKEQCKNSIFFMQKPRRKQLVEGIKGFAASHGVGVIFMESVPSICDTHTIKEFTGGCPDPFNVWKRDRYSTTKRSILSRSRTDWASDYIKAFEEIIDEYEDSMFNFCVEPQPEIGGFSELYVS